ncbi:MAG: hypothetical protein IJ719_21440 [Clostridia bacterium]|nr:hypothetical protein [Clostridia bacterium]
MDKQQRIEEVGKYIEKYYIPGYDDIVVDDEEVKGFFDKITEFLSGKKEREKDSAPAIEAPKEQESVSESSVPPEFDITTAKKRKISRPMSEMTVSNRKIDDLMSQMDETFSQRLLRMIKERKMSESEAYKKAFVDRRHFAKIKKDEYYAPSKKTVLAFAIALELTLDETKDLLRSAGYALSRSSKFDIIVVYFLENRNYNMFDINEVLYEYDQPIFE